MKLFEHQKEGIELLANHDSFGLFWDMGTCKTLTMLIHLSNLALAGLIEHALWVAPKSALGAVPRDFEMMRKNNMGYRADALEPILLCINYEKLSRKGKWRTLVEETEWDAIVLDEAHCIARPSSNRTKYIVGTARTKGIACKAKYRYLMTGTPVTNSRFEDFWSFLQVATGGNYYNYATFEREYLQVYQVPGRYYKMIRGYKNTEDLLEKVASYSQSVTKEECLDLPPVMPDNVITIPFKGGKNKELGKTTQEMYDDALENVIEATDEVFDNALVRTLRLRQIATGHITTEEGVKNLNCEKLDYAMELIEANRHKTVVFYQFEASFQALSNALKKKKIPFMYLNGSQSDKTIWREFQEASDDECRVFLAQYQSANAGIDLFSASDTIYYEPCVSSTVLNQSRSRTNRNGQIRSCTFTFLLTEGTIEEDMYNSLKAHEDFNERLWLELKLREKEEQRIGELNEHVD